MYCWLHPYSAYIHPNFMFIIHKSGYMPLHISINAMLLQRYWQLPLNLCTSHAKLTWHWTCQLHLRQTLTCLHSLSTQPISTIVVMTTTKYFTHVFWWCQGTRQTCCAVRSFAVSSCAVVCSYAVLCRYCCKAILCDWDPLGKDKVTFRLMYAVMLRLGQSPEHLRLPPQDGQLNSAHKGHDCPGCNTCSGPDWQWKTEAVASLLPYFCECYMFHQLCSFTCKWKKWRVVHVPNANFWDTQTLSLPSRCGTVCLCAHSKSQDVLSTRFC